MLMFVSSICLIITICHHQKACQYVFGSFDQHRIHQAMLILFFIVLLFSHFSTHKSWTLLRISQPQTFSPQNPSEERWNNKVRWCMNIHKTWKPSSSISNNSFTRWLLRKCWRWRSYRVNFTCKSWVFFMFCMSILSKTQSQVIQKGMRRRNEEDCMKKSATQD